MIFLKSKRLEKKTSDAREPSLYRSICTSIISTLLSLVMLVGTTFAWFTDSITSNVFTITASNVKVSASYCTNESDLTNGNWKPLTEASEMFGGELFSSGTEQAAYLKLDNEGSNAVKYKIKFYVMGETGGILLVDNSPVGVATQSYEAYETSVEEAKSLSDMMRFEYAVAEDVNAFLVAAQSTEGTSESNGVQVGKSAADPFQIVVSGHTTTYVKLTLRQEDYVGKWTSLPSISLKLKIVITQPGDNDPVTLEDEQTSQQANENETENVTEPVENEKQPIVTVGVDMTTEIETPVQPVAQPQQPVAEETESGDANTDGSTENADDANTAGAADAPDSPVDTAAVEPNAADDTPAADPAA